MALAAQHKVERKSLVFAQGEASSEHVQRFRLHSRHVAHQLGEASFFDWCTFMNVLEENYDQRFVSFENLTMSIKNSGMIPTTGMKKSFSVDIVTYRYVKPQQ